MSISKTFHSLHRNPICPDCGQRHPMPKPVVALQPPPLPVELRVYEPRFSTVNFRDGQVRYVNEKRTAIIG